MVLTDGEFHLVAVWHMAFEDAVDVVNINPRPRAVLQSHGVTQDEWQGLSLSAGFHRVCAELFGKQTQSLQLE